MALRRAVAGRNSVPALLVPTTRVPRVGTPPPRLRLTARRDLGHRPYAGPQVAAVRGAVARIAAGAPFQIGLPLIEAASMRLTALVLGFCCLIRP